MRQCDALAESGVENGFILFDLEFYAHGLQANDISGRAHRGLLKPRLASLPVIGREGASRSRLLPPRLVAGIDGESLAIVGEMRLSVGRAHLPQGEQRALENVAADIVERPHFLLVEAQVWLGDQGLAV